MCSGRVVFRTLSCRGISMQHSPTKQQVLTTKYAPTGSIYIVLLFYFSCFALTVGSWRVTLTHLVQMVQLSNHLGRSSPRYRSLRAGVTILLYGMQLGGRGKPFYPAESLPFHQESLWLSECLHPTDQFRPSLRRS